MKTIHWLIILVFISLTQTLSAQDTAKVAEAQKMGMEAVKLIDKGQTAKAIELLEAALKLDPKQLFYEYEIGYAHFVDKNYAKAIKHFEKVAASEQENPQVFQMLGNCYDLDGKVDKAIATYDLGLKKFPNSGRLYYEKGIVFSGQKKYKDALEMYEKGILVDPSYPSCYYGAALLYLQSSEEVWGMVYAELFMLLEPRTRRTEAMSKAVLGVYKSEIKFISNHNVTVSFTNQHAMTAEDLKAQKFPFESVVYEPLLNLACAEEDTITVESLNRIRTDFLVRYYEYGFDKKYPNILFEYQKKVLDAGHFEAYNRWLLLANDKYFDQWVNSHLGEWDAFLKWFSENPLKLNDTNKFTRPQK